MGIGKWNCLHCEQSLLFSKVTRFFPYTVSVIDNLTDVIDKADCKKSRKKEPQPNSREP